MRRGVRTMRLLGLIMGLWLALGAVSHAQPARPIPVKVVVLTTFEIGAVTGDRPGEFQPWVEGLPLTETIAVPGLRHPARYSPKDGVLGVMTDMRARARESVAALLLDKRFDFSKTYWLVAGIAGVDPKAASIGSAAWARYVVDADPIYEVDDREIPADWPYGLYALETERPNVKGSAEGSSGMVWALNWRLVDWAYGLTAKVEIPDHPGLAALRAPYAGEPNAQRPPFVLKGEALGATRFWHGAKRTQWAQDWVKLWTDGAGVFVMTDCEDQGILDVLDLYAKAGRVDFQRVMVLRTASNYSRPPLGAPAFPRAFHDEGAVSAFDSAYRVGSVVVRELTARWDRYEANTPDLTAIGGAAK
ncbi:purine nucleoside permease [Caulobacter vibrioides]|uniref:Purine nucleoside permease n=1 Tax=Caulobacter vibrioides TaxID=155892 RepID=A0A290N3D1_CAUVI|nr:purine nucleoside permease [Caulobacter vibrioides]ATC34586.1 purine nucleoside permease [Caulobacter vibrioides]